MRPDRLDTISIQNVVRMFVPTILPVHLFLLPSVVVHPKNNVPIQLNVKPVRCPLLSRCMVSSSSLQMSCSYCPFILVSNFISIFSLDAAGYNSNQCCPAVPEGVACASIEAPVQCGDIPCKYSTQCAADAAGFTANDCCALPAEGVACAAMLAPVTCGPAKCEYSNQCVASSAGHNEEDCCAAVPADTVCTADFSPLQCGPNQCPYDNLCLAEAAGFSDSDCCPTGDGACTAENDPVKCDDKCSYPSQSCADLAGFTEDQCCKQPKEVAACTANFAPVACSTANCIYDNACIAGTFLWVYYV